MPRAVGVGGAAAIHALLFVAVVAACGACATGETSASASLSSPGFDEDAIKCKVCLRSVEHMWHRGVILREACQHPSREMERDAECELSHLRRDAIRDLVAGTCEALPRSYQALAAPDSGFDLVLHDAPTHAEDIARAISDACVKFVHDAHKVDSVALLVFSNLDAGKHTNEILAPLQHRFCHAPCGAQPPPHRRRRPSHHVERHEDYTHALRMEAEVAARRETEAAAAKAEAAARAAREEDL